ncbi:hypothetical protein CR513_31520, partial [Mucuna pruriens]
MHRHGMQISTITSSHLRIREEHSERRPISVEAMRSNLAQVHSGVRDLVVAKGGHYGSSRTTRKVLDCRFYWPTIFRDAQPLSQPVSNARELEML